MLTTILGVDDGVSECGLDDVPSWDLILNNNSPEDGEKAIQNVLDHIQQWKNELRT